MLGISNAKNIFLKGENKNCYKISKTKLSDDANLHWYSNNGLTICLKCCSSPATSAQNITIFPNNIVIIFV